MNEVIKIGHVVETPGEMQEIMHSIARDADEDSQPVDLVVYLDTERIVIGKAGVKSDGTMTATIDQTLDPRVEDILCNIRGEFSFGLPRRLHRELGAAYVTKRTVPSTVALDPEVIAAFEEAHSRDLNSGDDEKS